MNHQTRSPSNPVRLMREPRGDRGDRADSRGLIRREACRRLYRPVAHGGSALALANLDSVATRRFGVLLEWDADQEVWVSFVPSLDSLSTFGETREEAIEQTREAIAGYLEAAEKESLSVPSADLEPEIIELEVATR